LACQELPSTPTQSITNNLRDKIPRFTQAISIPAIADKFYAKIQLHLLKTYETPLKNVDSPLALHKETKEV
jgi:hypothetical protein